MVVVKIFGRILLEKMTRNLGNWDISLCIFTTPIIVFAIMPPAPSLEISDE